MAAKNIEQICNEYGWKLENTKGHNRLVFVLKSLKEHRPHLLKSFHDDGLQVMAIGRSWAVGDDQIIKIKTHFLCPDNWFLIPPKLCFGTIWT